MKKIIVIALAIVVGLGACKKKEEEKGCTDATAQNYNAEATEDDGSCAFLASTSPQKRNAVLEEYTGVQCTYCPDGHRKAQAFADANPGKVVLINIHTGFMAVPTGGYPDYRTALGASLASFFEVTGFPSGTMNRYSYPGAANASPYYVDEPGKPVISRSGFQAAGNFQFTLDAPVNIGLKSTFNSSSRVLTVTAELYYTGTETVDNLLNIFFLENNVIGKQKDGGVVNATYVHKHMLRAKITADDWGLILTAPQAGNRITKTFTYTVPATYVIENCDVAAFVTRADKKIILNGAQVKASS
jgi:thiol-disulfide isomerase/thioredoxin